MEKYRDKYRISSARAQWWDYGNNAAYFITICTHERISYFGKIKELRFIESPIGKIATQCWHDIPRHFQFVELGSFVVMPNHIHGIIVIDKPTLNGEQVPVETRFIASPPIEPPLNQSPIGGFAGDKNPMNDENLARIVRWYKGRCSFEMRKINADFKWQSRYHDHVIRSEREYQGITDYINTNPLNWEKDKFFK